MTAPSRRFALMALLALALGACGNSNGSSVSVDGKSADASTPDVACKPTGAPTCSIDSYEVDCNLAFSDLKSSAIGTVEGTNPREICAAVCANVSPPPIPATWILQDKGACGHSTRIVGLDCTQCCALSDVLSTQLRCDFDPCTSDWCEGSACHHDKYAWIGAACSLPDAPTQVGVYACDASGCGAGLFCDSAKLKKCVVAGAAGGK